MFGEIQFVDFDAENGPAEAKKAWAGVQGWTGSSFKPIKYLGDQPCKGVNHWFFAEESTMTNPPKKKMIVLAGKLNFGAMSPLVLNDSAKAILTFNKAVCELGLKLIEDYRAGKCSDRNKTLESIIEIFKVSQRPFLSGGIIDEF